jgi:hypothetical protein
MENVIPRYEFRAFAQHFGLVEDEIRRRSQCERIRESCEIYILTAASSENNTKVRDELMDIKTLLRRDRGLEQWAPRMKGSFPLSAEQVSEQVFPAFGVPLPSLQRPTYTLVQLLDELVRPHPDLVVARVFKRRFGFSVDGCTTELAELSVNGAAIGTAAVEGEDPELVLETRQLLGLGEYENVNYLLALKRIVGMEPLSLGCWGSQTA